MTIKHNEIECDGYRCHRYLCVDHMPENWLALENMFALENWLSYDGYHYCEKCAPIVRQENGLSHAFATVHQIKGREE